MSDRAVRLVVALIVPVVALAFAHWLDQSVLQDALRRWGETYQTGAYANALTLTHVVGGMGGIGVLLAAFWARSILVGAAYAVVGGAIVLVPAAWSAVSVSGAAPEPIARFLNDQMFNGIAAGPTGIALTIAGAMLVAGLAAIAIQVWPGLRAIRRADSAASSRPA